MMSEEVCSLSIKVYDTLSSCVCFKFDNGGSSTAKVYKDHRRAPTTTRDYNLVICGLT